MFQDKGTPTGNLSSGRQRERWTRTWRRLLACRAEGHLVCPKRADYQWGKDLLE
jgi:hypothetical protein